MKYKKATNRNTIIILILPVFISFLLSILTGCSGSHQFIPPPPLPDDRQHISEPEFRKYNHVSDGFDKQFTKQLEQFLDISRQFRNLLGKPKQAFNVDTFDEVPNSSWFANRNAQQRMSPEEIIKGPNAGDDPDTKGIWTIIRAKGEGVTPGFHIQDKRGEKYLIKFDPVGYSELATGTEVVSTKLFYAAGYNVPENYIVFFRPEILKLGDKVKFTDAKGRKRYMMNDDLDELLNRIQKNSDGRIRALASKYIPGKPMGPFAYEGFRKDDPNDFIPHQHRRELRGLRVIAAWLNHTDTKSGNSFDSFITVDGKSFIRHYLIDFGSTLGSAAHGPMEPSAGHENQIDPHEILLNIAAVGMHVRPYEKLEDFRYASIGLYESDLFDPGGFKFNVPNPAFENCTNRDGFWGAKLVMSFTDEQLEMAVAQGQYSNPEAADYLLQVLKERRDKTGRYWFNKINPLDKFKLLNSFFEKQQLCFTDLAVEHDLESADRTRYRYDLRIGSKTVIEMSEIGNNSCIPLPDKHEQNPLMEKASIGHPDSLQWEIKIQTFRESNNKWSKWVKVYLGLDPITNEFSLIGILRQE